VTGPNALRPVVRPERPNDVDGIGRANEEAFGRPNEARLVAEIRRTAHFEPALSLVAEVAGRIVGHAMFSHLSIREGDNAYPAVALGPVAVLPKWQRQGVGSAMIRHGLGAAKAAGHRVVVLLGHPSYYPRFGFEPSARHGIVQSFPVGDASMVFFLDPSARGEVRGTVEWPPAFAAAGSAPPR